jgi:hypothetical protein
MVGATGASFIIIADATVDHVEKTIRLMVAKATMND